MAETEDDLAVRLNRAARHITNAADNALDGDEPTIEIGVQMAAHLGALLHEAARASARVDAYAAQHADWCCSKGCTAPEDPCDQSCNCEAGAILAAIAGAEPPPGTGHRAAPHAEAELALAPARALLGNLRAAIAGDTPTAAEPCPACMSSGWVGAREGHQHVHCPRCSWPCRACPSDAKSDERGRDEADQACQLNAGCVLGREHPGHEDDHCAYSGEEAIAQDLTRVYKAERLTPTRPAGAEETGTGQAKRGGEPWGEHGCDDYCTCPPPEDPVSGGRDTDEGRLHQVAHGLYVWAQAIRGDWGTIDGRTARKDLHALHDALLGDEPFDLAGWAEEADVCLCCESWTEFCTCAPSPEVPR